MPMCGMADNEEDRTMPAYLRIIAIVHPRAVQEAHAMVRRIADELDERALQGDDPLVHPHARGGEERRQLGLRRGQHHCDRGRERGLVGQWRAMIRQRGGRGCRGMDIMAHALQDHQEVWSCRHGG